MLANSQSWPRDQTTTTQLPQHKKLSYNFLPYLPLCFLAENSHAFLSSQRSVPYSWLPPWRCLLLIKEAWSFLEIISDQKTTLLFDIKATHPFYLGSWHFLPTPSSLCTSSFNKKSFACWESCGSCIHFYNIAIQESGKVLVTDQGEIWLELSFKYSGKHSILCQLISVEYDSGSYWVNVQKLWNCTNLTCL